MVCGTMFIKKERSMKTNLHYAFLCKNLFAVQISRLEICIIMKKPHFVYFYYSAEMQFVSVYIITSINFYSLHNLKKIDLDSITKR